jgi:hypothetical protein
MPTEQPSNAPQADAPKPTDDLNAAAVLADDSLDRTPGGGGLGGAKAADPQAGTAGGAGGTAPNSVGDTGLAAAGDPEAEARAQAAETMPSTGGRSTGG